ncbi:MAG: diphthine--ammonia ligase [Candidatus Woesearchaeota archaeon]|nr:diphthine--ammonia ligase [Candidatus Woesearchaeota archaeon]
MYATYVMQKQNYKVNCLITIQSKNPDSYMFHTPTIELAKLQAQAMDLPLILKQTKGKKEHELKDLKAAIKEAKEKYQIDGIITGALYSSYQRERIEKIADQLQLKIFSPLWHLNQETYMKELLNNNFKIIMTSIAADGLDKSWLNKEITNKTINDLVKLNKINQINVAGEGGEYETLVLDAPLFNKKIIITNSTIKEDNKNTARLIIKKAEIKNKIKTK